MSRTHQHFCWKCFGAGMKGQGRKGGWWPCNVKHCTHPPSVECKYHREQASQKGMS